MRPRVGQIYQERYLISAELGSGGMGSVFRATQTDANRIVALKILHSDRVDDQEDVARFYREFRILSTLSHPGIMTLYGLALDDDSVPYAICEYIDGVSLRKPLLEGPLPWRRAVKIVMQVCQAMQYAHEQGILHRDLKPDNILLMQKPEPDSVKLIDFGLSRAVEALHGAQKLTTTGLLVGSPQYMSPEQITGKATVQSDIYALGCILFELLSGNILVDADSSTAVIYKQLNEDMTARLATLTKVPAALVAAIDKMLKKTPEERFHSMSEVQQELEKILEDPDRKSPYASSAKLPLKMLAMIGIPLALLSCLVFFQAQSRVQPSAVIPKKSHSSTTKHVSHTLIDDCTILRQHKKYAQAFEILKKALDSPQARVSDLFRFDIHSELAYCYEETNKFDDAIKEWQLAQGQFEFPGAPKRIDARSEIARIYSLRGNEAKADELYSQNIADCESSGNIKTGSICKCYNEYCEFLLDHEKAKKAYLLMKKALLYSNKTTHGSAGDVTQDRATSNGVKSTWVFYDVCHELNKDAEAMREIAETERQLRASTVQDNYTFYAIQTFANAALDRNFYKIAKRVYEFAIHGAPTLPAEDTAKILANCRPGLAIAEAKLAKEAQGDKQSQ